MMGVRTPETCSAVNKRQDNKLEKLLHLVGNLFQEKINCCDTSQYNPAKKVLHIHTSFENTKYTIFLQLKNRWIK